MSCPNDILPEGTEPTGMNELTMSITDEDRAEAKRIALLPEPLQREVVAAIGSPADNPEVPAEFRKESRRRAKALKTLLRLDQSKRKGISYHLT